MRFITPTQKFIYGLSALVFLSGLWFSAPHINQPERSESDALDIVVTHEEGTFTATCSLGCNWGEVTWECDDEESACSVRLTERGIEEVSSPDGE
jgi:hypothetical protein